MLKFERERERETERQRQRDRQTDRQTDRETDRQSWGSTVLKSEREREREREIVGGKGGGAIISSTDLKFAASYRLDYHAVIHSPKLSEISPKFHHLITENHLLL